MIKPEELRIGNKILYGKSVVTVVSIESKNLSEAYKNKSSITVQIANGAYISVEDDGYSAIELTEEWLLKFGFEKKAEHNFRLYVFTRGVIHAYTSGKVEIEIGNKSGYSFGYPLVYFVHQLQNLYFALTGSELTIKEDK